MVPRREAEFIARENQTNNVLKAAEDKSMSIAELQKQLMLKETSFKEIESSTIKELNGYQNCSLRLFSLLFLSLEIYVLQKSLCPGGKLFWRKGRLLWLRNIVNFNYNEMRLTYCARKFRREKSSLSNLSDSQNTVSQKAKNLWLRKNKTSPLKLAKLTWRSWNWLLALLSSIKGAHSAMTQSILLVNWCFISI